MNYTNCPVHTAILSSTGVQVIHILYRIFRKELITKVHNYVHLNLCIALTLGLVVFLAGVDTATSVPVRTQMISMMR